MKIPNFFLFVFFICFFLAGFVSAEHPLDFERQAEDIANNFASFLDERVDDALIVAGFNYLDIDSAKNLIKDFYNDESSEIWFNIGSDNIPVEQRKIIPIYRDIVFVNKSGVEVIKYNVDGFSEKLVDVSFVTNTDFKSETYFSDAKEMREGSVFISDVNTWYVGFDYVFRESSEEAKVNKIYEEVVGRDVMKQGIIRFSSPVYDGNNFLGIVVLSVDYRHFEALSKHVEPLRDDPVVSSSYSNSYVLVFDIDGNTIIHPKPNNIRGYLDDGELAGFNEPNSVSEGNIFNLYKYSGSFAYGDMAKNVLEDRDNFISSATDVAGRRKITVSVPILYSNSKTNYAEKGVFGGVMMSINTTEEMQEDEIGFYIVIFSGIIILLAFVILFLILRKKNTGEKIPFRSVLFGRINRKFLFILAIIFLAIIFIGGLVVYFQNQVLEARFSNIISGTEKDFLNIQEENIRTLSTALEVVLRDESMKQIYLKKDREKLFDYVSPLFQNLKEKYQITHFYFIEPSGINFVRLHDRDIYGDRITRNTFLKAKSTKDVGAGIELGRTSYALRVVMPYYDGDELIGYVELGQEVDEFLKIMKRGQLKEFSLIVEKDSLNEEDWVSFRETEGLRSNWDDLGKNVIISSTTDVAFPCFSDSNVEILEEKTSFLGEFVLGENTFACGGFVFIDASGDKSGVVFSLIDVTEDRSYIGYIRVVILGILFFLIVVFVGVGFYVSEKISKPIAQLDFVAQELQKKNFDVKADVRTGDELEGLSNTLNETVKVFSNMDKEYKQLEKAKTEFLSITSHELRSPMTPMQAQLQMLLGEYYGKLNSKQKNAMEIVSRNTKRLDNIIVDFLEISRIEAARLKFRFVKKNPADVILRLAKELSGFMPEKKIKIVTRLGKLPVIEHDPDRLSQVLRNLLNNAIKFSKPGSIITIRGEVKQGMIEFSVEDHGIGVAKIFQKKLFEPFFQAEQTIYRENQGTGLGLAIIKGIVESQNGKVWIESEVGRGTIFYFTLPLKPVKVVKPIKLLFSEDENRNEKIREVFLEVLGPMGKQEADSLDRKDQLDREALISYIELLVQKGILTEQNGEVFKEKILGLFGRKMKVKSTDPKVLLKKGSMSKRDESIQEKLNKKDLTK